MLIKILEDVHDITSRLKEIDSNYFVVYNTCRKCFEIHNSSQKNTFCLVVPYGVLDSRSIDLTLKTRRELLEKILAEIDATNEKIEKENDRKMKDKLVWKIREFASSKCENFNDAYKTKWV